MLLQGISVAWARLILLQAWKQRAHRTLAIIINTITSEIMITTISTAQRQGKHGETHASGWRLEYFMPDLVSKCGQGIAFESVQEGDISFLRCATRRDLYTGPRFAAPCDHWDLTGAR